MANNMTRTLLSEYYGFGSEKHFGRPLSSHTDTSVLDILPDKIEALTPKLEEEPLNMVNHNNTIDGNIASKSDEMSLLTEQRDRSSKFLNDVISAADNDDDRCELFLDNNLNMNEYVFKSHSHLAESKESLLNNNKAQLKPLEDISDANWMALEETASDIRSAISSPMPKKRSSRKLKTSVMRLPPPPKKAPVCNGVYLDLTATGISEFPLEMLDKLSNLRMLYLGNNQLLKLPNELFSTLKFLHWIDVRNNKLTDLPSNIAWHPCLKTILLQGNQIEKLPLQLCLIPKLKTLQVTRNPLVFPPQTIVERGTTAVLEYMRKEWEKIYPEAENTSKKVPKELEKDNDQVKPDFTTILCYEPKSIPKKKKVSDQLPDISSLTSNSSGDANSGRKTVRQKSWEYKPSNRYSNEGKNFTTAMQLMWMSEVKEMLNRQALALQCTRNKAALKDWRQDKRSYDKSIEKAGKRTAANIPFAVNADDYPIQAGQNSKMRFKAARKGRHGPIAPMNIDRKVEELFESLSQLQIAYHSRTPSPRTEQKLFETELRKITDLQDQVQCLKRYNDVTVTSPLQPITCHRVGDANVHRRS